MPYERIAIPQFQPGAVFSIIAVYKITVAIVSLHREVYSKQSACEDRETAGDRRLMRISDLLLEVVLRIISNQTRTQAWSQVAGDIDLHGGMVSVLRGLL